MWVWVAIALAGRADGIQKLLDTGRLEDAQDKCEKASAWLSDTEPELREVCAEAMWAKALKDDTFAGWVRFQTDWVGTQKSKAAFEMEAKARLRDIGDEGSETEYAGFLKKYGETSAAVDARKAMARVALKSVETADQAKHVARTYPDAEGLVDIVRRYFDAFVALEIDGDRISAKLDPEVRLPGALLTAQWGVRRANGVQPWVGAAVGHLDELKIPRATTEGLARKEEGKLPYPPCDLPGEELGVWVKYGDLEAFLPQSRPCGGKDPAFVAVRDGAMVGLTLRAGVDYRFGTPADAYVQWVDGDSRVNVPLLGEAEPRVFSVGPVLGQKVGRLYLLHPLAGGLPWYVVQGPPDTALELPGDPASVVVPADVRITSTTNGDTLIERGDAKTWSRTLPAGSVRVWSPLFQELTGLSDQNPAFRRVTADTLPAGFQVEGSAPVVLEKNWQLELEQELGDFRIQIEKAWQLQLEADPKLEVVFEGLANGKRVKGVIDPREGSAAIQVFVFEDVTPGAEEAVLFRHQSRTWFGWKTGTHLEALHFDGRGLVRSWTEL
ncbi:MAG: hypothetical protein H6737_03215 [Alphaproteobacteria bacterium]|nr:hypothetical protein [Alphaproteobacteria bacterium]